MTSAVSLRFRLLAAMLTVIMIVGGVTLYFSHLDSRHEIEELFDAEMAQFARMLLSFMVKQIGNRDPREIQAELNQLPQFQVDPGSDIESGEFGHVYEKKIAFQFLDNEQNVILKSTNAPAFPLLNSAIDSQKGFRNASIAGQQWRIFSLWDKSKRYLVLVGERNDVRNELATLVSNRLLAPSLISLPILSLLVWIAIGRGLLPLQELVGQVYMRDPKNLSALETDYKARELRPLIHVLNNLFLQLRHALENERRFTGDAAHELRTPLAAVKTQAQVALRATNDSDKNDALQQVIKGVNRSSRLLEQLLTLARLDHNHSPQLQMCNINEAIGSIIGDATHMASKKRIRLQFPELIPDRICNINSLHLQVLLRNLLENAINYSKEGSMVYLTCKETEQRFEVAVIDQGPGIPDDILPRIFDRFYRADHSGADGCGLGLSIVKQISDQYQLNLQLRNVQPHGLEVSIQIPLVETGQLT